MYKLELELEEYYKEFNVCSLLRKLYHDTYNIISYLHESPLPISKYHVK